MVVPKSASSGQLDDGERAASPSGASTSQVPLTTSTSAEVPTSRVDRLLRERIKRSRSSQHMPAPEPPPPAAVAEEPKPPRTTSDRLIVVANRLPVTCSKDADGRWKLQVSAGGLVSALMGVQTYQSTWIGWPGIWVKPSKDRDLLTANLMKAGYIPVWLDQKLMDLYYNGFCNSVLWQLFHYEPLNLDTWQKMAEHNTLQMQWHAYQQANELFAQVVREHYNEGDIMWVQDYHLMLLPSLLKHHHPKMKVGFFLHTPFPSSEIYRMLPYREEVLRGVLQADLIGFHTYDYSRHFISSCTRILGLEGTPEGVEDNGHLTRVAAFPIGIDPERFTHAIYSKEVQDSVEVLVKKYKGHKVMLGVDRLDMIKGIPQKLLAFERFLEEHPEWRDKVLLVQIAVPSRTDVPEYQKLRSSVHEIVGRINGRYGGLWTHMPIHYLDRQLSFIELCALYYVTDVALVTSLRDGMNLVSYEYVACQGDHGGVLVLSEFAGAAQSLGAGSILVNPWNVSELANAIHFSLIMTDTERRARHSINYMHVATHTAQTWADTFISELNDTHIEADLRLRHTPPLLPMEDVVEAYRHGKRRLLVLGYNATLTTAVEAAGYTRHHYHQLRALTKVNPRVTASLAELCEDPANVVVVFSGSECSKLEDTFGHLPVWLVAENGVYVRAPATTPGGIAHEWKALFDALPKEWMESVRLVLDYFCERTPCSYVDARDTSLVWNYKYADVEFGRLQARDLLQHLWTGPISNAPVEIIQGGRSVEVRPVGITKGLAMQRVLTFMTEVLGPDAASFDFVLAIGHLLARDENMYTLFEGQAPDSSSTATAHPSSRSSSNNNSSHAAAVAAAAAAAATATAAATAAANGRQAPAGPTPFADPSAAPQDAVTDLKAPPAAAPPAASHLGASALPHLNVPSPPPATPPHHHTHHSSISSLTSGMMHLYTTDPNKAHLRFPPEHLFTCSVGRSRSKAKYSLNGSHDVADLLDSIVQQVIHNGPAPPRTIPPADEPTSPVAPADGTPAGVSSPDSTIGSSAFMYPPQQQPDRGTVSHPIVA